MYEDKTIVCIDCGKEFIFTAGEQEFYASKNLQNEPKRCKACRDAKKQYHVGVCAACGKEARVPFKPREGDPIYCSVCHAKNKEQA